MMGKFPRPAVTKYHNLGGLKQQKCIVLKFWKPEVQNQGSGQAMLPLKLLGEDPSLPLPVSVVCRPSLAFLGLEITPVTWPPSPNVPSHHLPLCASVSVSIFSPSIRTPVILD